MASGISTLVEPFSTSVALLSVASSGEDSECVFREDCPPVGGSILSH